MMQKSNQLVSFVYDPTIYGIDHTALKTISGNPGLSNNKIVLNQAELCTKQQLRYGSYSFLLTIPYAPTSGDNRAWGLKGFNNSIGAMFEIVDTGFMAITSDGSGSTKTTAITWNSAWTGAAKSFDINWSYDRVVFSIGGVTVATHYSVNAGYIPRLPLFADVSNSNDDVLTFALLTVQNTEFPLVPIMNPNSVVSTYESIAFKITGAQSDYSLATEQGSFKTPRNQVMLKTDAPITIKFNSTSNDGFAMLTSEEKIFDNMEFTDIFITTAGDTHIRLMAI